MELGFSIDADVDEAEARGHIYASAEGTHAAIVPNEAMLSIGDRQWTTPVNGGDSEVVFEVDLDTIASTVLEAWFIGDGPKRGAYYVYVERVP